MTDNNHTSRLRPVLVALFALLLLSLGFMVGFGYQTRQHSSSDPASEPAIANVTKPVAPTVKGLHVSPDDRLLAFTAVYDKSRRSSRFILDLKTLNFKAGESPFGWQDYITQWSTDSRRILFEREKIPQVTEETKAGLYVEQAPQIFGGNSAANSGNGKLAEPEALSPYLPPGERVVAGLWTPDGRLVIKTRRETKALFSQDQAGSVSAVDRSPATYYQNRAVQENGKTAFYVVRDVNQQAEASALYRVQNGRAQKLTPDLQDVAWSYVSENGRWMIVCRIAQNEIDWRWSLYRVTPQRADLVKENTIPADVSAVYWSPDFKHIVGAWGKSLWVIDIPTLTVRQLGKRTDWMAQDVAWFHREKTLIVAAGGRLWKVDAVTGAAREFWKFPERYWH